jgi:hypothetical protein
MLKEIEMAKISQKDKTDQAELKVKQDELLAKDKQHQQKLANDRAIAQAQMQDKGNDQAAKAQIQNEKLIQNREAHQAHVIEKQQDMQIDRQKADAAMALAQQKRADQAQRSSDQRAQQAFRMVQPTGGRRA